MNLVKLSAILVGLLAITTIVTRVEAAEGDTGDGNDTSEGANASEGGSGEETASTATDSEDTTAFCASVPSAEDIAEMGTFEYYFPNCDNERCPEEGETPDLSVLTYTMKCLRDACDGSAKQAGIDKCIKQLEIQQKNIFQFKPENYEQQLDKACDCKYGDVKKFSTGGDDPTTVCDAKWVHNCRIPSAGGACMNAMGLMVYDGYCEST
ncbi:uncharacterized protein LOC142355406, partial [Convolutriloba macropyga]|uniref:uncharacterized protein LOC142355406 n=1 Tax=Convolutriloba macropyga TaxID=536237 RepID=UPI003F5253E1